MKTRKKLTIFFGLCVAALLIILPASFAQDTNTDTPVETALLSDPLNVRVSYAEDDLDWMLYFRPGVMVTGNGRVIGYFDVTSYHHFTENTVGFINARYSHDNDSNMELNFGAGVRYLIPSADVILGANAYWDWRETQSGNKFQQFGFGAEVYWEIDPEITALMARTNVYLPYTGEKMIDEPYRVGYFRNTSVGYYLYSQYEEPLTGIDYEAGFRIPYISNYVETWLFAGGYHYWGDNSKDINGFMTRLEVSPIDFLKLNYEYRIDNRSDEHYGEVVVELPFSVENLVAGKNPFEGIGDVLPGNKDVRDHLYDSVRRDIDIKVGESDPEFYSTGEETEVIFVNLDRGFAEGTGTYDDPYGSIENAFTDARWVGNTCDTFFVWGTENLSGYGSANGIDLTGLLEGRSVFLWGSGYNSYNLPGMDWATLYNSCSTVLRMITVNMSGYSGSTTNIEIAGFRFINPHTSSGSRSLRITRAENANLYADIHHNYFSGGAGGIWMCRNNATGRRADGTGAVRIYENTFEGTYGVLMSNSRSYDIYNNYFILSSPYPDNDPGGAYGIFGNNYSHSGPVVKTFGDHRIYNNYFTNASYPWDFADVPSSSWGGIAIGFDEPAAGYTVNMLPIEISNNRFYDNRVGIHAWFDRAGLSYSSLWLVDGNAFEGNEYDILIEGPYAP